MLMQIKLIPDIFVRLAEETGVPVTSVFSTISENDKKVETNADKLMAFILHEEGVLSDFQGSEKMLADLANVYFSDETLSDVLGVRLVDFKLPSDINIRSLMSNLKFIDKGAEYPIFCTVDMESNAKRPLKEVYRDLLKIFYNREGEEYVNRRIFRKYLVA